AAVPPGARVRPGRQGPRPDLPGRGDRLAGRGTAPDPHLRAAAARPVRHADRGHPLGLRAAARSRLTRLPDARTSTVPYDGRVPPPTLSGTPMGTSRSAVPLIVLLILTGTLSGCAQPSAHVQADGSTSPSAVPGSPAGSPDSAGSATAAPSA